MSEGSKLMVGLLEKPKVPTVVLKVGVELGAFEGLIDGIKVGDTVGTLVGSKVGDRVGTFVGLNIG